MAVKPVVTIDVDSTQFERFTELFNDYSAKLEDQPEAWQKLNAAMGGGAEALKDGAMSARASLALAGAQAVLIAEGLGKAVKEQNALGHATDTTHKGMKGLASTAKGLGSTIFGIGKWITGIGIASLGLGALASGFGFGALASSALNRQRSSNQLGLSPGQLASFQVNAQQFLDIGALRAAAETQVDVSKAGYLAALGIDFRTAQNETASALAFQELKAARAAWLSAKANNLPPMQMPAVMSYLALGGNAGDIRNAAMQPLSALNAADRDTRRGAGAYEFDRGTAAEWITLKKALDSAGVTIETGLIKALAPLAPQIATLSREVVNFIASFLNSKDFGIVVDDAKQGLKALGNFLVTTDWKAIGADIGQLSSEVTNALRWLHLIPSAPGASRDDRTPAEKADDAKKNAFAKDQAHRLMGLPAYTGDQIRIAAQWMNAHTPGALAAAAASRMSQGLQIAARRALGQYSYNYIHAANMVASAKNAIPAGLMDRLAMDESGYGHGLVSDAGALGVYQFMPGTAKGYGINPLDTRAASGAAGRMLAGLFKKYGSWDKVIAAYNWGGGNVDADIKRHGSDWLKYAPAETQTEVSNVAGSNASNYDSMIGKILARHAKALKSATRSKPTHVTITNSTSARVAVSVNAVAQ